MTERTDKTMTTYREMLHICLEKVEGDVIEVDGETIHQSPVFPIAFAEFTLHMGAIYVMIADQLCGMPFPDVSIGDTVTDDGEALPSSVLSAGQLLAGYGHILRRTNLFMQVQNFMTWLMDEPIDEGWYDYEKLSDKWNEYVEIANKRRQNND